MKGIDTKDCEKFREDMLEAIRVCKRCRMCVATCPTYEGWLTQTPVGRISAIYYHLLYGVGSDEELSALLYSCTTCRRCKERCKELMTGANPSDIIVKARELLVVMSGETAER